MLAASAPNVNRRTNFVPAAAPAATVPADTVRFIEALFAPTDWLTIRLLESWEPDASNPDDKGSRFVSERSSRADWFIQNDGGWANLARIAEREHGNVYFGVCPRFRPHGLYERAFQIRTVHTLWADLDHCSVESALERCQAAGLPGPSVVVRSGNGVHLYWLLDTPYLVDDAGPPPPVHAEGRGKERKQFIVRPDGAKTYKDDPDFPKPTEKAERLKRILNGIADAIDGDHVKDLARLLRLPGTLNRKNGRNGAAPRPCVLMECDKGRRYPLAAFEGFEVKPAPKPAPAPASTYQWPAAADDMAKVLKRARAYVQKIPGGVSGQKGSRRTSYVACVLALGFDLGIGDALAVMEEWNRTCSPPWSREDLIRKLQWASQQPGPRGHLRNAGGDSDFDWSARSLIIEEDVTADRCKHAPQQTAAFSAEEMAALACRCNADGGGDPRPCATADADQYAEPGRPVCAKVRVPLNRKGNIDKKRIVGLPCNQPNCEACLPDVKARAAKRFRHHLSQLGDAPAYIAQIPDRIWTECRLGEKAGKYGRVLLSVGDDGDAVYLVTSTAPLPGSRQVKWQDAARAADAAVHALRTYSADYAVHHPTSFCRAWPDVVEDVRSDEWEYDHEVGPVARHVSIEQLEAFMKRFGGEPTRAIAGGVAGRGQRIELDFTAPADEDLRARLLLALQLGDADLADAICDERRFMKQVEAGAVHVEFTDAADAATDYDPDDPYGVIHGSG